MNEATTANRTQERRAVTLVMACVGVFVAYLPVTSVSVSLPAIQRALDASTSGLSWVSDAFVLPMAALILTAGVFGDVHGRKKVFQAGLAFTAAGAATALCAQSIEVLWAGQALAGIGAASLLPTTLAMISQAVPDPRERGKFVGLWASSLMAALAVGPLLSGVILDHADWRWIYLPSIPVALLAMAVAAWLVKDSRAPHARALDWPGQITATVAITALVYGVIEGGAGLFSDSRVLVALALAVVGLIAFLVFERRSASPMLDLKLFRSARFSATSLIAMITFMGLIGFFFVLSLYFGMVQQLGTLDAGYRLLMVTGVCFFVGPLAGRMMHRISPRLLISVGLLCAMRRAVLADVADRRHRVRPDGLAPCPARARHGSRRHSHDGDRRVLRTAPSGGHGRGGQQRAAAGRRRARSCDPRRAAHVQDHGVAVRAPGRCRGHRGGGRADRRCGSGARARGGRQAGPRGGPGAGARRAVRVVPRRDAAVPDRGRFAGRTRGAGRCGAAAASATGVADGAGDPSRLRRPTQRSPPCRTPGTRRRSPLCPAPCATPRARALRGPCSPSSRPRVSSSPAPSPGPTGTTE